MPAKTINTATGRKLALCIVDAQRECSYVLYDAGALRRLRDQTTDDLKYYCEDFIIGFIDVSRPRETKDGESDFGASTVTSSAAQRGYGPLLYDIAMALEGGLISDRFSVSPAAKKVWTAYKRDRGDIDSLPLDDIKDPKTPTTIDDDRLHPGGRRNALNYAYFTQDMPNVTGLISNHAAMAEWLETNEIDIAECAEEFFNLKYN